MKVYNLQYKYRYMKEIKEKIHNQNKWIALINEELKAKWFIQATKQDIETNYMYLVNLGENKLKEMLKDDEQPMILRILIKSMLSWNGFNVIEKILDRWIWKPIQNLKWDLWWKWKWVVIMLPRNWREGY